MSYYYNGSYTHQRRHYRTLPNYQTGNPVSSSCLSQVLSTYASGATILCLDPKEKPLHHATSRPRIITIILIGFICLILLGVTVYLSMDKLMPETRGVDKSSAVRQNRTVNYQANSRVEKGMEANSRERVAQTPLPINPVIYSFDFDDTDANQEARVETLRW